MAVDHQRAYGANPFWLHYHGLRDRLRGERARANARWGYLRPPQGEGKVVWIKTGSSPLAVRLGVELLGAIRQRRLDLRLVLTYQEEYRDILEAGLGGVQKMGFGFGPADAPRAVRRVMKRLAPLGIIFVEDAPSSHLAAALAGAGGHGVVVGADTGGAAVEAWYPANPRAVAAAPPQAPVQLGPAADLVTILTQAQVEPSLASLVRGGGDGRIAWVHGGHRTVVHNLPHQWQGAATASDWLILSGETAAVETAAATFAAEGAAVVRLSQWQRQALAPGTVIVMDEPRWLPAVAAASDAIFLADYERQVFWQALAAGSPVAMSPQVMGRSGLAGSLADLSEISNAEALAGLWRAYGQDPGRARREADACRRLFWEERRRATAAVDELMQRVYDW